MPVIKRLNQAPMQSRVYTERVDFGGGATARALANIGAEGAKVATALLQERKEDEARTYAMIGNREKGVAREMFLEELQPLMNQADGTIREGIHKGKKYAEVVNKWEVDRSEEYKQTAPTELAKRYYTQKDDSVTTVSTIQAEQFQHAGKIDFKGKYYKEGYAQSARGMNRYVQGPSKPAAIDYAYNEINKNNGELMKDNILDDSKKSPISQVGSGEIATAALHNFRTYKLYDQAAEALMIYSMSQKELDTVAMTLGEEDDGSVLKITKKDEGGVAVTKLHKDGSITSVADLKSFSIGGEIALQENKISASLTPAQHQQGITNLFKDLGRGNVVNNQLVSEMVTRVGDNLVRGTDGETIISGKERDAMFVEALTVVAKSKHQPYMKRKMSLKLIADMEIGTGIAALKQMSSAAGSKYIQTRAGAVKENLQKMQSAGIMLNPTEAIGFGSKAKIRITDTLNTWNERMELLRDKGSFQSTAFGLDELQKAAFTNTANTGEDVSDWKKWTKNIDAAGKALGKKGDYFPQGRMETAAKYLNEQVTAKNPVNMENIVKSNFQAARTMGGDYPDYINRLEKTSKTLGLKGITIPLMFSRTTQGYDAAVEATSALVNQDANAALLDQHGVKISDFVDAAIEKLAPFQKAVLNRAEYGGRAELARDMGEVMGAVAARKFLDVAGVKDFKTSSAVMFNSDAFNKAIDRTMNQMFYAQTNMINEDGNFVATPVSTLHTHGIQVDPETGVSKTMDAAVRFMQQPEIIAQTVDYEAFGPIKSYLDDAGKVGKKERDEALIELLDDGDIDTYVTNTTQGLVLRFVDTQTGDAASVTSSRTGTPLVMKYEEINDNPGVQQEERDGRPFVQKAIEYPGDLVEKIFGKDL